MQENPRTSDRTILVPALLVSLSLAAMGLFFFAFYHDLFPLGIPGEWQWFTPDAWSLPMAEWPVFLLAGAVALLLIGWAAWSAGWVDSWSRGRFVATIGLCIALGAIFQYACEVACPDGLQKWAMLQSYAANGFYAPARLYADDLPTFLANHADLIRDHHPHHLSVNPPGWVVVYGATMHFFADHAGLVDMVGVCTPEEMRWRLRRMNGTRGVPLNEQATIAAVAILSRAICFLGAVPVAWLAAVRWGRRASLAAASAALLVPVDPLFAPRCDTIYPTIALTVLALSHAAWDRRSWAAAALAGALLGIGTFFSMCFFSIGGLAILYIACRSFTGKRPTLACMAAAPLGWLAVVGLIYLAGHNSWATWSVNLAKNLEFNQLYRQSYGRWTVVNLLEFGWAIGLPVVIFLAGRLAVLRQFDPLLCAWGAMLALLDLAGANRGESCRLWIFMMPIGTMLAVEWLPHLGRWFRPTLAAFLALQCSYCVLLDRNLLLLTDLEPSRAFNESGLSNIDMSQREFKAPRSAVEMLQPQTDPPDATDGETAPKEP
ncbi:MAG TPA: hypothetical protein VHC22_10775 [Pirellulales bacterium]|nr:hypothetical protein [Pirellulales bacterium]